MNIVVSIGEVNDTKSFEQSTLNTHFKSKYIIMYSVDSVGNHVCAAVGNTPTVRDRHTDYCTCKLPPLAQA